MTSSLDCVDLNNYAVFILADSEKAFSESEIEKLRNDFEESNISILIFSEWNNSLIESKIGFTDKDTYNKIIPNNVGGSNISYTNAFLENYGISLGKASISSEFNYGGDIVKLRSASIIEKFPQGGFLFGVKSKNDEYLVNERINESLTKPIIGLLNKLNGKDNSGRLGVMTDTYCIDDYQMIKKSNNCFALINKIYLR